MGRLRGQISIIFKAMLSANLSISLHAFGDAIFNNVSYSKFILILRNHTEKLIGILQISIFLNGTIYQDVVLLLVQWVID